MMKQADYERAKRKQLAKLLTKRNGEKYTTNLRFAQNLHIPEVLIQIQKEYNLRKVNND